MFSVLLNEVHLCWFIPAKKTSLDLTEARVQHYISFPHSSFGTYQLIYVRKALLILPGSLSLPFCDTVMIFGPTM